jgi:phosphatidylglycerophosphatase A
MNRLILIIARGFGLGRIPVAPGTMGSLLGLLVFVVLGRFPLLIYVGVTLLLFLLGTIICQRAEQQLDKQDDPSIVFDEVVGLLIALFMAPFIWYWVLLGFALFRLFDIWKPFPIRWLEHRVHGGLGIMLDDAVAGLYALIVLHSVIWGIDRLAPI